MRFSFVAQKKFLLMVVRVSANLFYNKRNLYLKVNLYLRVNLDL